MVNVETINHYVIMTSQTKYGMKQKLEIERLETSTKYFIIEWMNYGCIFLIC